MKAGIGSQSFSTLREELTVLFRAKALIMLALGGVLLGVPQVSLGQYSLTSGIEAFGSIGERGGSNSWTFTASAGESVILRTGSLDLSDTNSVDPIIALYGPSGTRLTLSGGYGYKANQVSIRATSSGTYTVWVIAGSTPGGYRITLVRTQVPIVPSSGNGQLLTNGWMHTGSVKVGGIGLWSFNATVGDGILVRMGNSETNGTLDPYMWLYGPDGALVGSMGAYGYLAEELQIRTTNSGAFLVLVTGGPTKFGAIGGEGSYRLTLAKTGEAFITAPGDEGGQLTNGLMHTGSIDLGDADIWSFNAKAGEGILVRMGNLSTNGTLDPYLRLYGPDGALAAPVVGGYGYKAEDIAIRASSNGVYTVVLTGGTFAKGGVGQYRLTLAKTGDPIVTSPGDEGGPMTNGFMHTGFIDLGDVDIWTFDAKAGDAIFLQMGNLMTNGTLDPYFRLFGPDGAQLALVGGYGYLAETIAVRAVTNGTFLAVVSGGNAMLGPKGGTGAYRLTLAKTGAQLVTAPGDEGGPMTNGFMHTGFIDLGDADVWSVDAKTGDSIVVRMGDLSTTNAMDPYFRLYGPDGRLIQYIGGYGYIAEEVTTRATTNGTFMVVLNGGSRFVGGTGSYRITLAKNGDPIAVGPGDEGGTLGSGEFQSGSIPIGDLDVWSFYGLAGSHPTVEVQELTDDNGFQPWVRLYGPDGRLVASQSGLTNALASIIPTTNGLVTVVVADTGAGYSRTGSYQIRCQCTTNVAILGHVYCICNSNALAGASVQIGTNTARTDFYGVYSLSNVPPGTYSATVSAVNQMTLTNDLTVNAIQPVQTNDFYLTNATFLINPIIDKSITALSGSDAISNAILSAAQQFSQYLADPICVQIQFSSTNIGVAMSLTPLRPLSYSKYLMYLKSNPHPSENDISALSTLNLPPDTGLNGNTDVKLTAAILDVLGEHTRAQDAKQELQGLNSHIFLNISVMKSRSNPNAQKYDLQTAATHEIDEVLGIGGNGSTLALSGLYLGQSAPSDGIGPLDLYRYDSPGSRSFTLFPLADPYFSIDGGTTVLTHFSQSAGNDFGDWGQENNAVQVQDAVGTPGAAPDLGKNELIALDVIGYRLFGNPQIKSSKYLNNKFTVELSTVPGQMYQLQSTLDLGQGAWHNIGLPLVATDITGGFTNASATDPQQFYRVNAIPTTNPTPLRVESGIPANDQPDLPFDKQAVMHTWLPRVQSGQ